ncbi:MAG TPA: hypothetical protein EYN07_08645 [Flavobacteriaceae bacterium]|nr:hypothetical protein [Flavobacteriaceae bacterium]HIN99291.1 hypothetical protein [Flavobacteriaceae bacterium]
MKFSILPLVFVLLNLKPIFAQQPTASEVLEKAIAYHDPNGNWANFNQTFQVTMTTPNNADRVSDITINLPEEYFSLTATRDRLETTFTIDKGTCTTSITDSIAQKGARTPCETAALYKNYYTYLYGLPMKLKDPGANLSPKVEKVRFKDKDYLKLKVTYDETVGSDVWFFYFNPTTYAMEVYQFFKGDPNGKGKDTGEYILLSEETTVQDIKMPKIREWYYNKDDKYLGTDTITK